MIEKFSETIKTTLKHIIKKMSRFIDNDYDEIKRKKALNQTTRNETRETKKAKLNKIKMFAMKTISNKNNERINKYMFVAHSFLQKSNNDVFFSISKREKKNKQKKNFKKIFMNEFMKHNCIDVHCKNKMIDYCC